MLFANFRDDGFCLVASGGHDGVVIIKRDHGQDHVGGQGVGRANEGFCAAGAFQAMEPKHGQAWFGFEGMGNFAGKGRTEAEGCGGEATEFQKATAAHALAACDLIDGLGGHDVSPVYGFWHRMAVLFSLRAGSQQGACHFVAGGIRACVGGLMRKILYEEKRKNGNLLSTYEK